MTDNSSQTLRSCGADSRQGQGASEKFPRLMSCNARQLTAAERPSEPGSLVQLAAGRSLLSAGVPAIRNDQLARELWHGYDPRSDFFEASGLPAIRPSADKCFRRCGLGLQMAARQLADADAESKAHFPAVR